MKHYGRDCDAIAYIEWGGMYDVRELESIEYEGSFSWDDHTGGYMTIHEHLRDDHTTRDAAKQELIRFCFDLGESNTYIDFGIDGIVRKRDCARMETAPWNWVLQPVSTAMRTR